MFTATLVLIVILAILLILIVFIQNSKGGLNQSMGTSSNQLIGVKKTTDVLEKITWGLAVSIMVLCLVTNFVVDRPTTSEAGEVSTVNMEKAQESQGSQSSTQPATSSTDTSKK
jgi:preprotein translocase subunit SecG